jgi:hypothetical protein
MGDRVTSRISSPIESRTLVRQTFGQYSTEVVDSAVLLTSEIATYALLRSLDEVVLAVDVRPDHVRVEVQDGDGLIGLQPLEPERDTASAFGSLILERLASGWGIERRDFGKAVVWFTLAR